MSSVTTVTAGSFIFTVQTSHFTLCYQIHLVCSLMLSPEVPHDLLSVFKATLPTWTVNMNVHMKWSRTLPSFTTFFRSSWRMTSLLHVSRRLFTTLATFLPEVENKTQRFTFTQVRKSAVKLHESPATTSHKEGKTEASRGHKLGRWWMVNDKKWHWNLQGVIITSTDLTGNHLTVFRAAQSSTGTGEYKVSQQQ